MYCLCSLFFCRAGFLFTAIVSGVPGFLCAFSPNYATLLALRFVVGLGLGGNHVLPTWFLEFVPAENRGSWIAAFTCFWTLGTILEALLAWVLCFPYSTSVIIKFKFVLNLLFLFSFMWNLPDVDVKF